MDLIVHLDLGLWVVHRVFLDEVYGESVYAPIGVDRLEEGLDAFGERDADRGCDLSGERREDAEIDDLIVQVPSWASLDATTAAVSSTASDERADENAQDRAETQRARACTTRQNRHRIPLRRIRCGAVVHLHSRLPGG